MKWFSERSRVAMLSVMPKACQYFFKIFTNFIRESRRCRTAAYSRGCDPNRLRNLGPASRENREQLEMRGKGQTPANHPRWFRGGGTKMWQAQIVSDRICPRSTPNLRKRQIPIAGDFRVYQLLPRRSPSLNASPGKDSPWRARTKGRF